MTSLYHAHAKHSRPSRRAGTAFSMLTPLLISACGTSLQVTPFAPGKYPPRPADHPVQMFSTVTPACPYEELGLLRAKGQTPLTPWQQVVDDFLARARDLGGDGVIVKQGIDVRAAGEGDVVSNDVLTGTVIRFPGGACPR